MLEEDRTLKTLVAGLVGLTAGLVGVLLTEALMTGDTNDENELDKISVPVPDESDEDTTDETPNQQGE